MNIMHVEVKILAKVLQIRRYKGNNEIASDGSLFLHIGIETNRYKHNVNENVAC